MRLLRKIANKLVKILYWPICRAYARYILNDNPADVIFRTLCAIQYWWVYRFWPDFLRPQRFSEKVWNRMLFDRNPILTILNDKLQVRNYIKAKGLGDYLIPLLWSGESPDQIPFDELPTKFVLKANHGNGYNIIVRDKTKLDYEKTKKQLKKWLNENACLDKFIGTEWGYKNIKPCIIIESFIEENGKPPVDYKFYSFFGRVEIVTLHFDRFEEHKTKTFDRDFNPLENNNNCCQWSGEYQCPSNFSSMIQVAESLSKEFDFMRVDLYNVNGQIYFSELTPYPAGVSVIFITEKQDYFLGRKWHQQGM